MKGGDSLEWFGVRHVLVSEKNRPWGPHDLKPGMADYEERITLWRAASIDEAILLAESEAMEHADILGKSLLDFFQAFRMSDSPSAGEEVFSLIRRSDLGRDEYISRFFDTGSEFEVKEDG